AIGWASWAEIDKVTVGQGKVIPSSQIQVVQNLEGGLVKEILVKEGQLVEKGQQLLLIDDTRFRSDFREREQQVANLTASVLQLSASINSVAVNRDFETENWRQSVLLDYGKLTFPPTLEETRPQLTQRQKAEYRE
ncbi:biotin/lipoyl-binding protein, partial [Vibrio parahaemolyticus]